MKKIIYILLVNTFLIAEALTSDDYNATNFGGLDQTINSELYVVGPNDVFSFSMVTSNEIINEKLTVSPLGEILIPIVGKVYVDKMSLSSVFKLIENECKNKIQNSTVDVTLYKVKDFNILILGPSSIPAGYYPVNSFTRVSDIFKYVEHEFNKFQSDNLNNSLVKEDIPRLSSRNVKLRSQGNQINCDLLKFTSTGNLSENPYLKIGDVVEVNYANKFINIAGAVNAPGLYEHKKGESLLDFIKLSGGFKYDADLDKIEITSFDNDNSPTIRIVDSKVAKNFILSERDFISVKNKNSYKEHYSVTVLGEVLNPGVYTIENGVSNINDIIFRAGGYTSKADSNQIFINNKLISSNDKELTRIMSLETSDRTYLDKLYIKARAYSNNGSITRSSTANDKLYDQDVISVPIKYNFIDLVGAVVNPGRYPYDSRFSINDYIRLAGGNSKESTKRYYVIDSQTGSKKRIKSSEYLLEPQDIIFIEQKSERRDWDIVKETIQITSQVFTILAIMNNLK